MASFVPPKRAAAYRFYVSLVDQADTKKVKVNPTLAAGDVKVSKDGGAFANITTLPVATPSGSASLQVDLSATEMTADNIVLQFIDAAGAEWCDLTINLQTAARQIDDLAFPNVSGRGLAVDASGNVATVLASKLKKNTTFSNYHFLMTDSTTHAPATGKTVTVTRAIGSGAFAAGTIGSVTEVSAGLYRVDLPAADLNGDVVTLRMTASGCDDRFDHLVLED